MKTSWDCRSSGLSSQFVNGSDARIGARSGEVLAPHRLLAHDEQTFVCSSEYSEVKKSLVLNSGHAYVRISMSWHGRKHVSRGPGIRGRSLRRISQQVEHAVAPIYSHSFYLEAGIWTQ